MLVENITEVPPVSNESLVEEAVIVVTSGAFTHDAVEFESGRNLRLIAGPELHEMIREARAAKPVIAGMVSGGGPLVTATLVTLRGALSERHADRAWS